MIAKVVYVRAELTERIIPVKAGLISLLPVDAELVNPITEGKIRLEEKEITPTTDDQTVEYDPGYTGLSRVIVRAIPHNYGMISWSGLGIRVS